jgi:hypothetical protein
MKNPNTLTKISEKEFASQVFPILQGVFNYPGSFLQLFKPRLSFRLVDVDRNVMLEQNYFGALKEIGASEGYNGCYYTFIDYARPPALNLWLQNEVDNQAVDCWYVPFDEMRNARQIPCVFCQSFVSPKGDWGIFSSRDDFLVLGCTPEVGERLQALVPGIDKSIYGFLDMYDTYAQKLHVQWEWVPELIHHLYGRKYDQLLQKYKFHFL